MMHPTQSRLSVLLMMTLLLTAGCATTTSQLQEVSSGRTGCPPDAIAVSGRKIGMNTASWTATCHGKRYDCSGTDMLRGVSCVPTQ